MLVHNIALVIHLLPCLIILYKMIIDIWNKVSLEDNILFFKGCVYLPPQLISIYLIMQYKD